VRLYWLQNRDADDVIGHKVRFIELRSIFLSGTHAVSPMPYDGLLTAVFCLNSMNMIFRRVCQIGGGGLLVIPLWLQRNE
jgi:hypothetical protein